MPQPLEEMIARLERGLAQRGSSHNPQPPTSPAQMTAAETKPVASPLTAVRNTPAGGDAQHGEPDALLSDAMSRLNRLVSSQR